ncbi:cholesterol 7-alpha-monooxygenase [Elysia marginata]|uniref:Cholesterol 7-alpha-monooxygenase n=1 Tax=Elysia marginata TaxID=1093978 RepID=A0AAV4JS82_9GAST|nr:cholesterol 7-alpha-monooxygenase [Elysia marginata]
MTIRSRHTMIGLLSIALWLRRAGEPPVPRGHWFWGNCIQFKEHAVKFLLKAHAQCGDVFTVRFLNQHITMVLDVHSYEKFSKERNFDFHEITKQVNQNVFHYELVNSRKMISEAGQKVNGRHLFTSMENFALNLKNAFRDMKSGNSEKQAVGSCSTAQLSDNERVRDLNVINSSTSINTTATGSSSNIIWPPIYKENQLERPQIIPNPSITTFDKMSTCWHEDDLRNFASRTFFSPLFYTIFGRDTKGQDTSFHPQVFHKMFDQFHKYFNFLWLGVPHQLFPEAMSAGAVLAQQPTSTEMMAREGCSEYIKFATDFMLRHSQSEQDIVGHNLVFLHVNYNTFRVVYWCMYKLMEDAKIMAALREEVEEVVEAKRSGSSPEEAAAEFTADDIHKLTLVDSFLKEVIRSMSGVFMIRKVLEDTVFTTDSGINYNIRKGDRVAIYPPAFHYDPEIYEQPETFKFDRFVDATFYKNGKIVKHPLIGFGSLCPGQKFAILQIKWFIINLLNSFKLELLDGERTGPNTNMYGHEILPPTHDVRCRFLAKDSPVTLTYVNNYGSHKTRNL